MKKLIVPIAATFFLVGCGSDDQDEAANEVETAPAAEQTEQQPRREVRRRSEQEPQEPTRTTDADPRRLPHLQGAAEVDGHGLTMIVDGSSPEAFQQSLELIASDSTDEQYQQLDSAIRDLQMNSPEGWGGAEALFRSLDGMTGEEIIERAAERRRQSRSRQR
ncbi:hypothetical protein IC757_06750 [Wenzhouxiangella sp. AB-CW3]|uniref:hypothetical protein n=1 Tax=Wenzhouxiangella sp. AB-CW3 TaxID=2771012 RepID=UPI00168A4235|nr:hypothetical protein [Wenzhouxiangella sp. AB-CW3]QOC23817.1 hypothetical protein IC757_06750 [Wenzhouxiangella sp. AB-CW3]